MNKLTKLNLKIFNWTTAVNCAEDWFVDQSCAGDINTVLTQSFKIAAVPVMFNEPQDFAYTQEAESIDLSQFDLVLLSDIEYRPRSWIDQWTEKNNIKNWRLLQGGVDLQEPLDHSRCVYRPWWIYHRDLKYNQFCKINTVSRPYMFDILLGSRRPNRDFVMHALQQSGLLNHNIVTFRDVFPGSQLNQKTQEVCEYFRNQPLQWPYISNNLNSDWEVSDQITNSVSQIVPWEIYKNTWYSVAAESVAEGSMFFMAEKISKPMFAGRPFIVFGIRGFLSKLQDLGYQTFHPVIDESYDHISNDIERWQAAFDQLTALHKKDPNAVYQQLESVLEHNRRHLSTLEERCQLQITSLLKSAVPDQYFIN
jgi:hypothetical protein